MVLTTIDNRMYLRRSQKKMNIVIVNQFTSHNAQFEEYFVFILKVKKNRASHRRFLNKNSFNIR